MNNKLLLVDDDLGITDLLKELLELEGFTVEVANNGREAIKLIDETIDLILLDIMMPDIDGFKVLSTIKNKYDIPVIFLTAKDQEDDKIAGLELGADDYIVKPFSERELLARVRSLLRRTSWASVAQKYSNLPETFTISGLTLDTRAQTIMFGNKYLKFTATEYQVLLILVSNMGKVISRDTISEAIFGKELMPFDRTIDVHVSSIRKKLPLRPSGLQWIQTLRNKGYILPFDSSEV